MMQDLFIGILSGTSMNAIDVVAFRFISPGDNLTINIPKAFQVATRRMRKRVAEHTIQYVSSKSSMQHSCSLKGEGYSINKVQVIATASYPLPIDFRTKCQQIMRTGSSSHNHANIDLIGELDHRAGVLFADAIVDFLATHKMSPQQFKAIGSHGQTIRHQPNITTPFTMQIGDPNIIAERTGITTIADFRRRDLAAGGQGAPLAPAFHAAMFSHPEQLRFIINIGGITNITVLEPNANVAGFDVGPGNCLLDYWCQSYFACEYDVDGKIAAGGKVITNLLNIMLDDQFFKLPPPKSTGLEYFNPAWLQQKLQLALHKDATEITTPLAADILATLTQLTSTTIANVIKSALLSTNITEVYLCGGGAYNTTLINNLQQLLNCKIATTNELGLAPELVEAGLFAWLARECLAGRTINLTAITGAKHAVKLGGVYYA